MILVAAATVLVMLSGTSIESLTGYSVAFRIAAVGVLGTAALGQRRDARDWSGSRRAILQGTAGLAVGYVIFLFAATVPHGLSSVFTDRLVAVPLFVAIVVLLIGHFTHSEITNGVILGAGVLLASSAVLLVASPSVALENDRLRGVFENANLLGVVAAVFVIFLLLKSAGSIPNIAAILAAASLLALSGSRSSLLLLVICTVGFAFGGRRQARMLLGVGGVALLLTIIAEPGWLSEQVVLRTDNSRLGSMAEASRVLDVYPSWGIGFQDENIGVAGSVFGAAVQGGYAGVVGVLIASTSLIVASLRVGFIPFIFSMGAVAHSLFEGWLLALSGPMMITLILAWIATVGLQRDTGGCRLRPSEGADIRRAGPTAR